MDNRNWVFTGTVWVPMLGAASGAVVVSGGASGAVAAADDMANPTAGQFLSYPFLYDGTTWDRWRGTTVAGAGNVAEQLAPGAEDNTNSIYATIPKPLAVSTYCATLFSQFGTDPDVSVKTSAGNVFMFTVHNLNAATRYMQLHNKASAPANPDVPIITIAVPTGATVVLDEAFFGQTGINFSTGIAYGFSTTELTYTAGAAGDQTAFIRYK